MKKLLLIFYSLISAVTVLSQVPAYVPTNGLVGWWPFTGNANDLSGNGNNGSVNGAVLTSDVAGNANSAYHFDGSSQFIQIAHSASLTFNTNQISISFWIKVESFPSGSFSDIIISKQSGSGTTQSGFNVAQSGQTSIHPLISSGGGNFGGTPSVPSNSTNFNTFHHIVLVYSNGVGTSYLDGVSLGTATGQTAVYGANTLPLLFGKANWSNINATPFNGVLDEIGIWNRALTACEVTNLYNEELNSLTVNAGIDQTICQSETIVLSGSGASSYSWNNGVTNNVAFTPPVGSTTYTVTGTNGAGCSAQDQITVNVNPNTSSTVNPISCETYTAPDGQVYNSSGNYIAVIPNAVGCDSTITIDLTITNSNSGNDVITACDTYTWIDGNTYTSSNNSATFLLSNQDGCDSLVTLDLTLNNSTSSILNETALDSYTLNGQTYNQSGTYTQTLTNAQGCDSTITLNLTMQFTGIEESILNSLKVYPNPANGSISVRSDSFDDVVIADLFGNIVLTENKVQETKVIEVTKLPSGIYLIKQGNLVNKFIKQ